MVRSIGSAALPLSVVCVLVASAAAEAATTTAMLRGGVVINEFLPDPNGANNFDTDGDGSADTNDEFVELFNVSNSSIDLNGLQLWDAGVGNWFTFSTNANLAAGQFAYVVVDANLGSGGSLAANGFDAAFGTGGVINNGSDDIFLYDPIADEYIQAYFNKALPLDPTTDSTLDPITVAGVRIGPAENFGSDSDGRSLTRNPAGDTATAQHHTVASTNASPGAEVDGSSGGGGSGGGNPAKSIMEIQGPGHGSPEVGNVVETTGVVTVLADNGFYMQDPVGDGNIATSDGVFVFTGNVPTVNVGESVTVNGTVAEFFGETQLGTVTSVVVNSVGHMIQPVVISTDPMTAHRVMPDRIVDDAGAAVFDEVNHGRDFYESLEGMLVRVPSARAVSDEDTRPSRGEFYVVSEDGNPAQFNSRGGITITGDASPDNPIGADLNPERIQIDPESFANLRPHDGMGNILPPEMGDRVSNDGQGGIVGALHFAFSDYSIEPNARIVTTDVVYADEATSLTGSVNQLTTATYNLFNLDPTDPQAKFDALAAHIVTNLQRPDIIGLQEIQDNDGAANTATVAANLTLQRLVDAIDQSLDLADDGIDNNSASSGYVFIDNPFIGDDTNGGQPGGNIRTAFLYNENRVDLVPGSVFSLDQNGDRVFDPASIGATQTDPTSPFFDTRLPLGATFLFNGQAVTVVNNHLPSKGGSDPLFGTTQPPMNGGLAEREAIAGLLNSLVGSLQLGDPTSNIIVLGDFNEFQFLSPLRILEGSVDPNDPSIATPMDQILFNLADLTADPTDIYTFEFEGNSQALDHILVTDALNLLAEVDYVHINTGKLFETLMSDHDPIVARFTFSTAAVSEPALLALLLAGLPLGVAITRRRRG